MSTTLEFPTLKVEIICDDTYLRLEILDIIELPLRRLLNGVNSGNYIYELQSSYIEGNTIVNIYTNNSLDYIFEDKMYEIINRGIDRIVHENNISDYIEEFYSGNEYNTESESEDWY